MKHLIMIVNTQNTYEFILLLLLYIHENLYFIFIYLVNQNAELKKYKI